MALAMLLVFERNIDSRRLQSFKRWICHSSGMSLILKSVLFFVIRSSSSTGAPSVILLLLY